MNLFQCPDAQPDVVAAPTIIPTPLGRVHLTAAIDGLEITGEPPTQTCRLSSGGWLACWHQRDFDLELLVVRLVRPMPTDMPLTDCWAGLWRLRAHHPVGSCLFTAVWEDGYTWENGEPSTGEHLYAKTWDNGQTEVSIGTQDGDMLALLSHHGEGLPTEWESYCRSWPNQFDWFSLQPAHYEVGDKGVPVPVPPLKAGQQCQIHFAVAWAPYEQDRMATWLAVDVRAAEILAGGNGL